MKKAEGCAKFLAVLIVAALAIGPNTPCALANNEFEVDRRPHSLPVAIPNHQQMPLVSGVNLERGQPHFPNPHVGPNIVSGVLVQPNGKTIDVPLGWKPTGPIGVDANGNYVFPKGSEPPAWPPVKGMFTPSRQPVTNNHENTQKSVGLPPNGSGKVTVTIPIFRGAMPAFDMPRTQDIQISAEDYAVFTHKFKDSDWKTALALGVSSDKLAQWTPEKLQSFVNDTRNYPM